ncbi:sugar ABC transporter permease [Longispora fulva]|uniref:Multiple sugar transport system permease protein n=1 Tax=Longispora fulva TaxID=619741 RepID=A0A8J7KIZ1_9ACTN|nr:carbohydrate ABC transporter permease [Longispora fulva]MBG6136369.1 multiple sugar transport system permease protein [Longispora fulva]GIG63457.1 sugar ABC transporter permease [Longispora fulva]
MSVNTRQRDRWTVLRAVRGTVLLGFGAFCLIPLVWLLLAPTKTDAQLVNGHPLSFGSLAQFGRAWQHLVDYNDSVLYQWIANSILYSVGSLLISVATSLLAGYALAVSRIPGRKALLVLTLIAMMVPPTALVLPLFLELNTVHLTNTALSVILPASFYPFGVYLAFIYFSTSLPKELLEAGRLDGCSEAGLFWHLARPLAKPLIGLLSFFSFVANWNNYFLPYVMLSEESKYNLPVGLGAVVSGTPALNPANGGSFLPITRPEVALAGLLVVVPIAVIFVFCQRFLVRGILAGSVKN